LTQRTKGGGGGGGEEKFTGGRVGGEAIDWTRKKGIRNLDAETPASG